MAIRATEVQFLLNRIQSTGIQGFESAVRQLFKYFQAEVKDNPVYDNYIEGFQDVWREYFYKVRVEEVTIPNSYDEAKQQAFSVYKCIAEGTDEQYTFNLLFKVTAEGNFERQIKEFNNLFFGYLSKAVEAIVEANTEVYEPEQRKIKGDFTFIVHGHDNQFKFETQLLLNRAGINSKVLHEQPDKGRTIIEKLLEEGKQANYAIVLLSPDDLVAQGDARARQNVILEIGYFIGLLGRDRVRLIIKDKVEIPSDLQGILYEKFDVTGSWKVRLVKEMMAVGIYADLKATIETL